VNTVCQSVHVGIAVDRRICLQETFAICCERTFFWVQWESRMQRMPDPAIKLAISMLTTICCWLKLKLNREKRDCFRNHCATILQLNVSESLSASIQKNAINSVREV
jgi:hypothetical protein